MRPDPVSNGDFSVTPPLPEGYELVGELGVGGMGVVYQIRHRQLDRLAALKCIHRNAATCKTARARFLREARAAAQAIHPNIVQVYDFGERDGQLFCCMEYLDGGSLAGKLDGRPWPPHRAAQLVETLARAVHHLHRLGVIHRDLKPGNVLLTRDGTPKVADFGLASRIGDPVLTAPGVCLGTPVYMPPEQALGQEVGPAADVYSLGVIFYELLTGQVPFRGPDVLAVVTQLIHATPEPPSSREPGIPADFERVCLQALEKDPTKRFASAEALAEALRQARRRLSEDTTAPYRSTPEAPSPRRFPQWAVVGLLLAITSLGAGWALGLFGSNPPPHGLVPIPQEDVRPTPIVDLLTSIEKDIALRPPGEIATTRYLSLAHLPSAGPVRAEVEQMMRTVLAQIQASIREVGDAERELFAVDISRSPEWECLPPGYPYWMDFTQAELEPLRELARRLEQAGVDSPEFIRADWWVREMAIWPLAERPGLPDDVARIAHEYQNQMLTVDVAAWELGLPDGGELQILLAEHAAKPWCHSLRPFEHGEPVRRAVWESTDTLVSPYQKLSEVLGAGPPKWAH